MQRPATLALFASLSLLVLACTPTRQATNPDEIRQRYDAYNAAYGANDVAAIAAFYVDGAIQMPNDGSIIAGRPAIRDTIASFLQQNSFAWERVSAPTIQIAGNLAATYSSFVEHWVSKATRDTTRQSGYWLVVWERQPDGVWMISKEMWTFRQRP
jgi:uncharacterized protein (TIGR02246 family)